MILDPGFWILVPGTVIQDLGSWIQDPGSWIQNPASRILDHGQILYPGSRILVRPQLCPQLRPHPCYVWADAGIVIFMYSDPAFARPSQCGVSGMWRNLRITQELACCGLPCGGSFGTSRDPHGLHVYVQQTR